MIIEPRPASDPELETMATAQQCEIRRQERAVGAIDGSAFTVLRDVQYLVAVIDGQTAGCGAVQSIDEESAEIKRMYVLPPFRGRGVARRLLAELERLALRGGRSLIRIETGGFLVEANRLYPAAGYTLIPAFGPYVGNPTSNCYEKRLSAPI